MHASPEHHKRIEAMVDGRVVIEGTLIGAHQQRNEYVLVIEPTFVRAAYIALAGNDMLRVLPREERDVSLDDAPLPTTEQVHINASELDEIWVDGRLIHLPA